MAMIKITYKPWEYTCGDGCCYDHGINAKVEVGAFTYSIESYNEDDVLKQFIERHYGDVIETEYEYDEE